MSHKKNFFRKRGGETYKLYIGGMGGLITSAADLANNLAYVPIDLTSSITTSTPTYSDDDITVFNIDSNNNIYAELVERYCIVSNGDMRAVTGNVFTCFIDLNGGLETITENAFTGNGTVSKLKFVYSKTAICRGTGNSTTVHRGIFNNRGVGIFKVLYLPADPQFGNGISNNNESLRLLTSGIKLFLNTDADTINSGSPDGDVTGSIADSAAVVTYCDDVVSVPDAVSDLSTGTITATTVVLNFTEPSSTNAVLQYEVWVDGAFWQWITASGGMVTGLVTATNYDIQIKTADIYYNISGFSNNVNFTTS